MRLFAAIPLGDEARAFVRDAVAALVLEGVSAKWVGEANWHVTLAFLGEVASDRVERVREVFLSSAAACAPFSLQLSGIGAFPNLQRPKVIYVGCESEGLAFAQTAGSLRRAFEGCGFRFDSEAIAHVTVGRKSDGRRIAAPALQGVVVMRVRRLVLYESVPASGSVRYDEIESVNLREPLMPG